MYLHCCVPHLLLFFSYMYKSSMESIQYVFYMHSLCNVLYSMYILRRKESRNLNLLVCKNNNAVDIAFPLRLRASFVSSYSLCGLNGPSIHLESTLKWHHAPISTLFYSCLLPCEFPTRMLLFFNDFHFFIIIILYTVYVYFHVLFMFFI